VGVGQPELGGVFDRDQALIGRDRSREDAEQRRLSAAGAGANGYGR
jgi:hypothetical protein